MARPFILQSNKGNAVPDRVIFFDVETKGIQISKTAEEQQLWFGYGCFTRLKADSKKPTEQWFYFDTIQEFWDRVEEKMTAKQKLYLVAHNVQFDFLVMKGFEELFERGFERKKILLQNGANIWTFKKGTKTLQVIDNLNYFKLPLKQLGDDLGLEKGKMPGKGELKDNWQDYCRRDVEIIKLAWETWRDYIKENDLGNFAVTLPSQAFTAYRHRFMHRPIKIHQNGEVYKLERQAYCGGRTEVFWYGKFGSDQYYIVDINSMYPAIMKYGKFPSHLIGTMERPSLSQLSQLLEYYGVVAEVLLNTERNMYPYRMKDKLVFPVGNFSTTLTTNELIEALAAGEIERVDKLAYYEVANLFSEYVDFFYSAKNDYKQKGMPAFTFISKLMLNSLYGKFGQKNYIWEQVDYYPTPVCKTWEEIDHDTGEIHYYRMIGGYIERKNGEEESRHSFPAIAAHITADARLRLYHLMEKAGHYNVFYCDTDSLFVNSQGLRRLEDELDENELGKLSLQDSASFMEIYGAKDYNFGGKVKMKGIRKDATQLNENTWTHKQFDGVKSVMQRGDGDQMIIEDKEKTLSRKYDKGVIDSDGRVHPYNI